MKKGIACLTAAWLLMSISCWRLDNPVDPAAANYQGYQTVGTPAEVRPASPADGATITFPVLRCNLCAAADAYALQIGSSNGDFTPPVHEIADSGGNTFTPADAGLGEGTYAWRVKARDRATGIWTSEWSAYATFTITGVPAAGIGPENDGTIMDTTPLLDWAELIGAVKYQVQIAPGSTAIASAAAVEATASEHQTSETLAIGDVRHWRVRAVNLDGVAGAWSATWSFKVSILDLVTVAGGTFQMGTASGPPWDGPPHSVTLTGYLMGKHEVTQSQYLACMGTNPANLAGGTDAPNRPIESVSWYGAVSFCNALSALEGLSNVYSIDGFSITADFSKSGYRLPTEAEWEFAARGGISGKGYIYSGSDTADAVAWYIGNSNNTTQPVGTKAANELGIHDMSGNVCEWCWDWYGDYSSAAQTDPTGASGGPYRVVRGGSWGLSWGDRLGCTLHMNWAPTNTHPEIGFRVVRRRA